MAREDRDPRERERDPRDPRQLGNPVDARDPRVIPVDPRDERLPGDERDARTLVDLPTHPAWRNVPATIIATAFAALGASLCLEPAKWDRTPAYGVLLDIVPQLAWGLMLLGIAAVLGVATWLTTNRGASIVAHFLAVLFTAGWAVAFTVRWRTDVATTPMNAVTWGLALLPVLVYSMVATARYRESVQSLRSETE